MKKIVSAPYIDQTERWVNGCESISSVMLLQAMGIAIDPDTFIERDHWLLADGTDFAWKCHEHCLLLVGYDDEHYWFNDPWHNHGVCAQPKALVEDCHAAQGMFAVTLKRK